MMRIAVAGGGGMGYLLASQLSRAATAYSIIVLSRSARPEFNQLNVELLPVDYSDLDNLTFALQGIDLAVSTISGDEQLNLINAAGRARVSVFVPSEFEGTIARRPWQNDHLQRKSADALKLLRQWEGQSRMRYTVFSCGLFMEHFHPKGLGHLNIGHGSGVTGVGGYLLDVENATAEYVPFDSQGREVMVCLTSVYDVVRLFVAAIDLDPRTWPHEFTLRGDRLSVQDAVAVCGQVLRVVFTHRLLQPSQIESFLAVLSQSGDSPKVAYFQRLLATAAGRYDFERASLNEALEKIGHSDIQPMTLLGWFTYISQTS